MTDDLKVMFERHARERGKFERIEIKLTHRPDLHAMLLLDALVPGTETIISIAGKDKIFFSIEINELAEVIIESQVIDLVRCGVRYAGERLWMFV